MEDLQAGPSSSKDQPVFVRHRQETGALFGKIIWSIKDTDLLQCSELEILLRELGSSCTHAGRRKSLLQLL